MWGKYHKLPSNVFKRSLGYKKERRRYMRDLEITKTIRGSQVLKFINYIQLFNIARIIGGYQFDSQHKPYRHFRQIEILKVFNTPISIDKWSQVQRLELVDDNDFIVTLLKSM